MTAERIERIPPHNLEAEQALLAGIICDPILISEVGPVVRKGDFYAITHETIYDVMLAVREREVPIDVVTLAEELRRRGSLERVGGFSYLSSLNVPQTPGTMSYYARLIREKAMLRALITLGHKITQLGFEGEEDAEQALEQADTLVRNVVVDGAPPRSRSLTEIAAKYDTAFYGDRPIYGTPWPRLDRYTGGFMGGELIVWGGDEGVGKSMLVTMLTAWTAEKYGRVALFATEMGETRTFARLLALFSGISVRRQREAAKGVGQPMRWTEEDSLAKARAHVLGLPLELYDADPAFSSLDIYQQCVRLKATVGLSAVFIDTVHFLTDIFGGSGDVRDRSTHERQKRALRTLRRLALSLDVPVHLVFHMNRPDQKERNPRPSRKRLRDGGNVEGDATCVIFPYRSDGVYSLLVDKAREGNSDKEVPMDFQGSRAVWLEGGKHPQTHAWFEPAPPAPTESFLEEKIAL